METDFYLAGKWFAGRLRRMEVRLWVGSILLMHMLFLAVLWPSLEDYYPLSADDGWIMSVSYKLATQGILGSDLYTGFLEAERAYFLALPGHHLLQALSFLLFGFGIAQARLPVLLSAVALLGIMITLAYRHVGQRAALLAGLLLLFWRSGLASREPFSPFLTHAQTGRYDLTSTTLLWATVWLADEVWRRPRPLVALALGLVAGLAILTQFYGWVVLPFIAIVWLWRWGRAAVRQPATYAVLAGLLLTLAPYLLFIATHIEAFRAQAATKSERLSFSDPTFYLDNLRRESERWIGFVPDASTLWAERPVGILLLLLGILPVLLYGLLRLRHAPAVERLPWLFLLLFAGQMLLFEQTKAILYVLPLVPGLCFVFALAATGLSHWFRRQRPVSWQRLARVVFSLGVLLVLAEGLNGYRFRIEAARDVSPYVTIKQELLTILVDAPPESLIIGSDMWWPALHHHPYLSHTNLFMQWQMAQDTGRPLTFAAQVDAAAAEWLIVSLHTRSELSRSYPDVLQAQFYELLEACGDKRAEWTDSTYERLQIYALDRACVQALATQAS